MSDEFSVSINGPALAFALSRFECATKMHHAMLFGTVSVTESNRTTDQASSVSERLAVANIITVHVLDDTKLSNNTGRADVNVIEQEIAAFKTNVQSHKLVDDIEALQFLGVAVFRIGTPPGPTRLTFGDDRFIKSLPSSCSHLCHASIPPLFLSVSTDFIDGHSQAVTRYQMYYLRHRIDDVIELKSFKLTVNNLGNTSHAEYATTSTASSLLVKTEVTSLDAGILKNCRSTVQGMNSMVNNLVSHLNTADENVAKQSQIAAQKRASQNEAIEFHFDPRCMIEDPVVGITLCHKLLSEVTPSPSIVSSQRRRSAAGQRRLECDALDSLPDAVERGLVINSDLPGCSRLMRGRVSIPPPVPLSYTNVTTRRRATMPHGSSVDPFSMVERRNRISESKIIESNGNVGNETTNDCNDQSWSDCNGEDDDVLDEDVIPSSQENIHLDTTKRTRARAEYPSGPSNSSDETAVKNASDDNRTAPSTGTVGCTLRPKRNKKEVHDSDVDEGVVEGSQATPVDNPQIIVKREDQLQNFLGEDPFQSVASRLRTKPLTSYANTAKNATRRDGKKNT